MPRESNLIHVRTWLVSSALESVESRVWTVQTTIKCATGLWNTLLDVYEQLAGGITCVTDKTPLLSTSKLRKHWYSVLLDQQQTIQKNGTTIALTDQNGLPTLELRLASRAGEVDEKMCAPVEEIGEEARRATPTYVLRDPQTLNDELTKSITCRTDFGATYCVRGRGKESPHLSRCEQTDDGIPVVQMDYCAFFA